MQTVREKEKVANSLVEVVKYERYLGKAYREVLNASILTNEIRKHGTIDLDSTILYHLQTADVLSKLLPENTDAFKDLDLKDLRVSIETVILDFIRAISKRDKFKCSLFLFGQKYWINSKGILSKKKAVPFEK